MDNRTDVANAKEPGCEEIPQSHIDQDQLEQPGVVKQMYDGWLGALFEKDIEEKRSGAE